MQNKSSIFETAYKENNPNKQKRKLLHDMNVD